MEVAAARRPVVPPGYRFTPTPEELIRCYLNPWVTGQQHVPDGVVVAADIYASDPDALTSRFAHAGHDGNWYFLCVARWKGSKAGTRMNRCVHGSGGTWHGSSKRKEVGKDGHRQGFEYRAAGDRKTAWIMEEFVTNLKEATDGDGVRVICKVYRSPRAPPPHDKVGSSKKRRPEQQLLHEENDVDQCYYATTSQDGPAERTAIPEEERYEAARTSSKRPRLRGEQQLQSLAACTVTVAPPPPAEPARYCYYYQPPPAVSTTATLQRQQPMMEQGAVGFYGRSSSVNGSVGGGTSDDEPEPLAVEIAGVEGNGLSRMDCSFYMTADDDGVDVDEWLVNEILGHDKPTDGVEDGDDPGAGATPQRAELGSDASTCRVLKRYTD